MSTDLEALKSAILGRRIDEALAIVSELEAIEEAVTTDTDPLSELDHDTLLKNLQQARDYSYVANMGDYSMASINRAQEQVEAAKQALIDAGYEVPTW